MPAKESRLTDASAELTARAPAKAGTPRPSRDAAKAAEAALHIPSLDGIRAASFLIVFLAHAIPNKVVPGYFGLTLFFFLSGYLITTLLRIEFDRTDGVSLRQFYLRRVLRIFPPFYLVLGTASLLAWLTMPPGTLTAEALFAQCFHFTNYYVIGNGWWKGMAPGTWVYWSLAVEEHFYVFFPLIYLLLRRSGRTRSQQARLLLAVCAVVLLWRCVLVFLLHATKDRTYVASDTRIDSIIAGCILAIWNNPVLDKREDSVSDRTLGRVWLPLGLFSVFVSLFIAGPTLTQLAAALPRHRDTLASWSTPVAEFEQTFRYSLQSFGLLPFFIAAVRWHDRGLFKLFNLPAVRYLGTLSYSMYLMHTGLLWALEHDTGFNALVRGALALAILIALGSLIYRFIEKPCARLRRKLSRYLSPAAST